MPEEKILKHEGAEFRLIGRRFVDTDRIICDGCENTCTKNVAVLTEVPGEAVTFWCDDCLEEVKAAAQCWCKEQPGGYPHPKHD